MVAEKKIFYVITNDYSSSIFSTTWPTCATFRNFIVISLIVYKLVRPKNLKNRAFDATGRIYYYQNSFLSDVFSILWAASGL